MPSETDVVVDGATASGVMAAMAAARAGHGVVLLEPGQHVGGMVSGGLGWTDVGDRAVIGGLAREFHIRVASRSCHSCTIAHWSRKGMAMAGRERAMADMQTWEIWYPEAAATGLLVARGRLEPTAVLWLHAAPRTLAVTVRDADDRPVARGEGLTRAGERLPMTRLWIEGEQVRREDRWPTDADLGSHVILPGGEVGTLMAWWHAPDGSEWRWSVEFYNHR